MTDKSTHADRLMSGKFEKPQDVVADGTLSKSEKTSLLTEWKSSLTQIMLNDPEADDVRSTINAIDKAMTDLGE